VGAPREPWCVIARQFSGCVITMALPEQFIDLAKRKGWKVVVRDTEVQWPEIEPTQQNPIRHPDE